MTREILRRRLKSAMVRRRSFEANLDSTQAAGQARVLHAMPDLGKAVPSEGRGRRQVRLSVGVDVVSVAEVSSALDRFGDRYVRRAFTTDEAAYCRAAPGPAAAERFAARFAAKEATVKALQPPRRWTDWSAIEVHRYKSGRCAVILRREAASLAERRGIERLELSMSHDGDHAVAVVVALRTAPITRRTR
jgi:holo-[acyl-carrier protein] synthase